MKKIHIWEKIEITLFSDHIYVNPYTQVEAWVNLKGPDFEKRVYGFWDGRCVFKVRITALTPGQWSWESGSNQVDSGLNGKKGSFVAIAWSDEEKGANACRRGMIVATPNGHAFQYADGSQVFWLADTWWAAATFRYPWSERDEEGVPAGPGMGFKEMVQVRKRQGYNGIAMIASFPTWANDDYPSQCCVDDEKHSFFRSAWVQAGTQSCKNMHNEGGRPFLFPGRVPGFESLVPDFDKINPEYFRYLDRKIDYLNENGFTPFIEVIRRDISQVWKNYYCWPDSYTRYIQYIYSRYQANNCLFSPIHFDWDAQSISAKEYNEPANSVVEKYGAPPFGTLVGTNASMSTMVNYGDSNEAKWLTFHQTGNWREHEYYWYLTDIFYNSKPSRPALNGEPYYPYCGNCDTSSPEEIQCLYSRSGLYGSLLSGGFAGHIYGAEGMWAGDVEESAKYKTWDAIKFESAKQMGYVREFIKGISIQDLIPDAQLVLPNQSGHPMGYKGWAYCARTDDKKLLLYYFEKECPQVLLRGLIPLNPYKAKWFNPSTGQWRTDARMPIIKADKFGRVILPTFLSDDDWCLKLEYAECPVY